MHLQALTWHPISTRIVRCGMPGVARLEDAPSEHTNGAVRWGQLAVMSDDQPVSSTTCEDTNQ